MTHFVPFLVTAGLLLLPLAPATFLYKVLTPKRAAANAGQNTATGTAGIGHVTIGGVRLKFNVVGSSATYIVLLVVAWIIYERADAARAADEQAKMQIATADRREMMKIRQASMKDQQAWRVRVPVMLRDPDKKMLEANRGELQAVRVELEPAVTTADARMIQFWVVPNNGRFPSARFNLTQGGTQPVILDLNDGQFIAHDYEQRSMESVKPVWIEVGGITPYSKPIAPVPAPGVGAALGDDP